SPLGGPLDPEIVGMLHAVRIPFLLGTATAMRVLKYLPLRQRYWARDASAASEPTGGPKRAPTTELHDFLGIRKALVASGVPVVAAELAHSEAEAVELLLRFGSAVAIKAEAAGLLHKSELDCVRLNCASEQDVRDAYHAVTTNARNAGFADAHALVQPM